MKRFLRIIVYIPASIIAFVIVLFLGMLLFDIVSKLLNFTSSLGGLINNRNTPNNEPGITILISIGLSGFFASMAYFSVGKWILPHFYKTIHTKIALYTMLVVLGVLLIVLAFVGFTRGETIHAIGSIVLLLELVFAAFTFQNDN